ncbi:MAG: DUF420 domain-containing protein [Chitinophagales bacterium]
MTQSSNFIKNLILIVSVAVPALVAFLFYGPALNLETSIELSFFPKFHASLNSLATLALLTGFYFIRQKNIAAHRASMLFAFSISTIFLLSYVFYHSVSEPTTYGGEGLLKYIYYFVLLTHIFLAAIVLPFILFTFYRALSNDIEKHKKIARWTFPMWLYVTVSGVLVYFLISPYY